MLKVEPLTTGMTMKINLSPFLQGILGGIIGVFVFFSLFLGFFKIMDRVNTLSFTCEKGKITSSRSVECEILEIKDLGNVLKIEDIASPPPEFEREFLKDKETSGKFIQVKNKIKNKRERSIEAPLITLIDAINRKYEPGWELSYWIPKEYQIISAISPGLEKEIIGIFEVPKDSQEPFKLEIKIFLSRFLD